MEFGSAVTVTAALEGVQEIREARLMLFQSAGDFGVAEIEVSVGDGDAGWQSVGTFPNLELGARDYVEDPLVLRCPLGVSTSRVRLVLRPAPGVRRILLGQIQLFAPHPPVNQEESVANVAPMQIKRTLDDALMEAGIPFLYECTAVGVLRDAAGEAAGVEIVNRAGRQAILAKVIVDATARAELARMAGAEPAPYPAGMHTFKRVVIGGEPRTGQGIHARRLRLRSPLGGLPAIKAWEARNREASRRH